MDREDYKEYFDILEITSDCSFNEIVKAYNYLKNLYSLESIATMPLEAELTLDKRERILNQISEAYSKLTEMVKQEELERNKDNTENKTANQELPVNENYSGKYFSKVRLKKGIKLHDLAFMTKISKNTLNNIEKENYKELPPDGYLRWHVKTYAKVLSLNPEAASSKYMKKYRIWKRNIINK